jgi:LysR family glycine cleavage system transcriptional activator
MQPLPLNALRVFEAAARHLSFAKAAAELNVTPAAVSHQIKGLEARLGVPLFRRLNRRLLLTDAAQLCLPGVRDGFERLAQALAKIAAPEASNALRVTSAPTFAARWLVPNLESFRARHPEIEIRIDATERMVDFAVDPIDIGIRYGSGRYPGLNTELLMDADEFPVCSPKLLEGPHPLRRPEDLRYHTLIHGETVTDTNVLPNWRMWLLAAGVRDVDPTRGLHLQPETIAIEAAINGQGVVLSAEVLVSEELKRGRLVKPFEVELELDFAYYLVWPKARAERPAVAAFRDWIMKETASARAAR